MKKSIIIAIIAAAIVVPTAVYAASPLFINTTIDEPVPEGTQDAMMEKDEGAVMDKSGDAMMGKDGSAITEGEMTKDDSMMKDEEVMTEDKMVDLRGTFAGAGDGIHDASGTARILHLEDGSAVLRLEDFRVTNGPDLFVYLSTDRTASDYVDLGMLKANSGNQNYELPDGVDLSKYDNVIIWCKSFSVYFGGAQLA